MIVRFRIADRVIVLEEFDDAIEQGLRSAWGRFLDASADPPWLLVRSGHAPVAWMDRTGGFQSRRVPGGCEASTAGVVALVPDEGPAVVDLRAPGDGAAVLAVMNLLHAAIAWRLVGDGGAMLHAAAAVLGGRGFVLVGAGGSGKSTWARAMRAAGATVLGDDIALVLPSSRGFDLVGSPLRAREFDGGTPGRWPLAAILLPQHAARPALSPVSRLELQAALVANLPFATDRGVEPYLEVVEALARTPARRLAFTRTDAGASLLSTMTA